MELSIQEQIFDRLRKANKILIALPENLTADAVASGLALKLFLQKMQKDVDLASSGRQSENLRFLPASDSIKSELPAGKSLVITLDTSVKKLEELSYQTTDDKVNIFLKSKGEVFEATDASFSTEKFPVDAIVTLDAVSLESLGKLFHDHADLFYETPKINIDHKAANDLYGAINLVDVTATSVAEILSGLLEQFEQNLLDEDIATALLTGIITKTNSFQHAQTTPEAFMKASRLVGFGGRQQEIIKNLFKTKSLPLLKLWGRVLARLKTDDGLSLVYSLISRTDFEKSESSEADVILALRELLENIGGYKLALVLFEQPGGDIGVLAALHLSLPQDELSEALKLPSHPVLELPQYRVFSVIVPQTSLAEAEHQLLLALDAMRTALSAV